MVSQALVGEYPNCYSINTSILALLFYVNHDVKRHSLSLPHMSFDLPRPFRHNMPMNLKRLLPLTFLLLLLLVACGGQTTSYTSDDAIDAFRAAGLEVGDTIPMDPNEETLAPKTWVEGQRFLIPSLGEDRGGRVMSFANDADLQVMQDYYEGFSGLLASWVSVKDNLLLQVSVDLPREQWLEYEAAFQSLP